ncbi:MAG TPA: glucose 1-dehydrogenase [Candidatus Synoicihabitans sp.]|nr:glucose 1-dehydrogenase [Candidatus Synoicihabitans sp.]
MSSPSSPFSLHGEVALVTGGGTGIGLAIARSMIHAGARVVIVGRRAEMINAAATELGDAALPLVHDVENFDAAPELIKQIEQRFGPVTILVNNAGVHLKKPAIDTSPAEYQRILNTHVLGAHALVCAVAPGMIQRRHGSILFIGSMASLFGIPNVLAYSAAKTAIVGVVRALATELSPHNVRVNAIAPGWIETEMSRKALDGDVPRRTKILSRTPMQRLGQPSDVGWAAVYLASPAAQFITGTTLPVDGGASIGF